MALYTGHDIFSCRFVVKIVCLFEKTEKIKNPGLFFSYQLQIKFQFQQYKIENSSVVGIQTLGRMMVGADETTEL